MKFLLVKVEFLTTPLRPVVVKRGKLKMGTKGKAKKDRLKCSIIGDFSVRKLLRALCVLERAWRAGGQTV